LTGTTGFVGKVVLEKILRSLTNCKRIYIMLRAKNGVSDAQRMEEIFNYEVFKKLFSEHPQMSQ
jgi:fatty acyl-CoA reductase